MRLEHRLAIALATLSGLLVLALAYVGWQQFEQGLGEQRRVDDEAMLQSLADHLDAHLEGAQRLLAAAAEGLNEQRVATPGDAQTWLDRRPELRTVFDSHLLILDQHGTLLAGDPDIPARRGTSVAFRSYYQDTVADGQPQISDPYLSVHGRRHPVVMMTAPVNDSRGRLVAILAGAMDLGAGSHFRRLLSESFAPERLMIVDRRRTFVAHPDPDRIFSHLPPGQIASLDRALAGWEGLIETTTADGRLSHQGFKRLRTKPWVLAATFPEPGIMATAATLAANLAGIAALGLLAIGMTGWWQLRWLLSGLRYFREHLASLAPDQHCPPISVRKGGEEVRALCTAFNTLADRMREQRDALAASESLYHTLADFSTDLIFWRDERGRMKYVSDSALAVTGYPARAFIDDPGLLDTIVLAEDRHIWKDHRHHIDDNGWSLPIEFRIRDQAGNVRWISHNCHAIVDDAGRHLGVRGSHHDITLRKALEAKTNMAASVFYSAREATFVTDRAGTILAANPAFCRMSGYREEELLGQNPRLFKSGRQTAEFYRDFWRNLLDRGQWYGELWDKRKNGELFLVSCHVEAIADARGLPEQFICGQMDITAVRSAQSRMEHLATHDPLTNLANRAVLEQARNLLDIDTSPRYTETAVMVVNLDRFKDINESFGRACGDEILTEVANRLQALTRKSDMVARIGGDEFGLVFPGLDRHDAQAVATGVLRAIRQPYRIQEHPISLSATIGISMYPDDGDTMPELLEHADTALHQAKGGDRDRACYYDSGMHSASYRQLLMETELRQAIEGAQLTVHYQPKVRLMDGALIGAEALVRWQHPVRGLVPPGDFVPAAERSGLIIDIGAWVFCDVCRQLAEWRESGGPAVPVAVNLAAKHFQSATLVDFVRQQLEQHQIGPELIELELTETTLLIAGHQVLTNLSALKEMGISLAIDDFGTGYSNLSYLRQIPISVLKVDKSFIDELESSRNDQALVASIVALGHSLDLHVIAEGVETPEQADILIASGCDSAQGYHFARPMPADCYHSWHVDRNPDPASRTLA